MKIFLNTINDDGRTVEITGRSTNWWNISKTSIGSRVKRSTKVINNSDGVSTNKGNDVSIKPGINIVSIGSRVKKKH